MEFFALGLLLVMVVGAAILWTRGVFARDLTHALRRVTQQEQALQEQAAVLERRLHQLEQEDQARLKAAEQEAQRLLQQAKDQAATIQHAALEEVKRRARALLLEAEQLKAQWRVEVAKELNGQAIRGAGESLRRLLAPEELAALHERMLRELVDTLKELAVLPHPSSVERVEVVTARALAETVDAALRRWVAEKFGAATPVRATQDEQLIAGGLVRLGSTVVDNSLMNRLQRASHRQQVVG